MNDFFGNFFLSSKDKKEVIQEMKSLLVQLTDLEIVNENNLNGQTYSFEVREFEGDKFLQIFVNDFLSENFSVLGPGFRTELLGTICANNTLGMVFDLLDLHLLFKLNQEFISAEKRRADFIESLLGELRSKKRSLKKKSLKSFFDDDEEANEKRKKKLQVINKSLKKLMEFICLIGQGVFWIKKFSKLNFKRNFHYQIQEKERIDSSPLLSEAQLLESIEEKTNEDSPVQNAKNENISNSRLFVVPKNDEIVQDDVVAPKPSFVDCSPANDTSRLNASKIKSQKKFVKLTVIVHYLQRIKRSTDIGGISSELVAKLGPGNDRKLKMFLMEFPEIFKLTNVPNSLVVGFQLKVFQVLPLSEILKGLNDGKFVVSSSAEVNGSPIIQQQFAGGIEDKKRLNCVIRYLQEHRISDIGGIANELVQKIGKGGAKGLKNLIQKHSNLFKMFTRDTSLLVKLKPKKSQPIAIDITQEKKMIEAATNHLKSFDNFSCEMGSLSSLFLREFGSGKGTKEFFLSHQDLFTMKIDFSSTWISLNGANKNGTNTFDKRIKDRTNESVDEKRKIAVAVAEIKKNGRCKLGKFSTIFQKEFGTAKNMGEFFRRNDDTFVLIPGMNKGEYKVTLRRKNSPLSSSFASPILNPKEELIDFIGYFGYDNPVKSSKVLDYADYLGLDKSVIKSNVLQNSVFYWKGPGMITLSSRFFEQRFNLSTQKRKKIEKYLKIY